MTGNGRVTGDGHATGDGHVTGDGHTDPTVRFSQVSKTYANGVEALRDVSLEIGAGDFAFVVGPTGVGKSTLLKLIYR